MSIIIDDKTHVVLKIEVVGGNMLGAIRTEGGKTHIVIRLRMQVDDKVWDSEDKKSWWHITTDDSPEKALTSLRMIFEQAPLRVGELIEIAMDETGVEGLMKRITELPGMFKMEIPAKGKLN